MSPLPSKPARPAVELLRSRVASAANALTQTTARERVALCAVAGAFITLSLGGLSYQRAHSETEPVASSDASSAIELRPAPRADTPGAVEVAARGDSDSAETSVPSDVPAASVSQNASESGGSAPGANGPGHAASVAVVGTSEENGPLVVYVTGAVKCPGVYTFRAGDRLYHAVRAAGGFKTTARQDALNLADRLEDGDQLYIPSRKSPADAVDTAVTAAPLSPRRVAEGASARSFTPSVRARALARSLDMPPPFGKTERARGRVLGPVPPVAVVRVPVTGSGGSVASGGDAAGNASSAANGDIEEPHAAAPVKFKNPGDGVVNLNTATAADLEKISGIGPAMSARILEYRAQIGKFNDPQQLMDVKGIGEKKFAKMAPFIVVK